MITDACRHRCFVTAILASCALGVAVTAAACAAGGAGARAATTAPSVQSADAAPAVTDDYAGAVALQRDGKIVVAGQGDSTDRLALARYTADGRLDPSFGTGGKVLTTDFGEGERGGAFAVAIQDDGKIVAAGWSGSGSSVEVDFALARYTPDGKPDPSFGRDGKVRTDFAATGDYAFAVVIQADGKIVAVGFCCDGSRLALARYTRDGRLDPSFGTEGKVQTPWTMLAYAAALLRDGRVVAAGLHVVLAGESSDFALAAYAPDGRLDPGFGTGGRVETSFVAEGHDAVHGLAVQADGKVVAAGESGSSDFALARYAADGSLDESFGSAGKVLTDFGSSTDYQRGLALQADGKIVAAGSSAPTSATTSDFALARYTPDGHLDPGFGSGGKVLTDFGGSQGDGAGDVVVQADGKIVAAGTVLARYTPDGRLDPSFGEGGRVAIDFAPTVTRVTSLSARRTPRGVLVRWRTAPEAGTRGFNVYRQAQGRRVRVNRRLLAGTASATRGASYSFLDRRAPRSRSVRYWVEDVRHDGRRVLHGPARVRR